MSAQNTSELRTTIRSLRPYFVQAVGFSIAITLIAISPIAYMREVYGPSMDARSTTALYWVTSILVLLLLTSTVLDWIRFKILQACSNAFAARLSQRVFDATFRAHLKQLPQGKQALSDLRAVKNFLSSNTLTAIIDTPLGIVFLLLVFLINPLIGIFSLIGTALIFAVTWITERKVRPVINQSQSYASHSQQFFANSARNAEAVEAMGMHGAINTHWSRLQNEHLKNQAIGSEQNARGLAVAKFIMLSQGSLILGIGILFTITGLMHPAAGASIMIAKLLSGRAVTPLMTLINSWKHIEGTRVAFERLDKFLSQIAPREKKLSMPAPTGQLTVEIASLAAPGTNRRILSDISFRVDPGSLLVVLGASGSGKSSLAKMLIGIWPAISGSVRLDGVDVAGWDREELGPHIGYLPQEIELFDGTLAQNIARFGVVDEALLADAIQQCGLQSLIQQMPHGLDTEIGPAGARLSGGQRQRIGLARAVYGNPKIIVLDEPNSNLDGSGSAALLDALHQCKQKGSTIVVITHRPELLSVADLVLLLHAGRIKMFGKTDEVMAKLSAIKKSSRGASPATPPPKPPEKIANSDIKPTERTPAPEAAPDEQNDQREQRFTVSAKGD